MHGASEAIAWADCKSVQEHYSEGDISGETCGEESVMGRRVLDGRLLGGDGWEREGWEVVERYVRNQGKPRESLCQLALF